MLLLSTALKKGKWLLCCPIANAPFPSVSANLGMIRFPPNLETTLRCSIDKTMRCCEQAARETCGEESSIVCLIPRGCAESLFLSFEASRFFVSNEIGLGKHETTKKKTFLSFCSYSGYSGLSVEKWFVDDNIILWNRECATALVHDGK